jgi:NAD(P)-dependent dehydrogenase (short-subunit alcohol dehydrogenase family)
MDISFEGQVVVVTGGGGGIGRMQALELGRRGAAVVVNDVGGIDHPDGPSAVDVAEEIRAAGGKAVASLDSVATPEGGKAIIQCALDTFGGIHAIIHLAGAWRTVLFDDMTADQIDPVLDVHLRGGFFVTHPAWEHMKRQGYGRIVLCSSSSGVWGRRFGTNYAAAKAGLFGLGRAMSLEGAEHGILVNCILPVARSSSVKYPNVQPQAMLDAIKASGNTGGAIPPFATSEMLVPLPTYLASRACTVTGEAFSGVGGRFARVFVAAAEGWLCDKDVIPTAEDIAAHMDEIENHGAYILPASVVDEIASVAERVAERDARSGQS